MVYRKFSPCEILRPFVECYFVWESNVELLQDLEVESPPSGFCSVVFNCGDPYYLQNKKYERLKVPKQFIAGQSIYSYKLFFSGYISIAGIVYKPAALATLYELPVYEYTEERIELGKIFREDVVGMIASEIKKKEDPQEKVRILEDFVLSEFNRRKPLPDFIDEAANQIVEKNGMLHINHLLENIYMSRRNFERRFFRKVGLSPKYYARLRRMSYVMNQVAGKKRVDWSKLFLECEFYDQSHFIKDFIEFTGRTPQQYLEENVELANLIDKPQQENLK
jgi:AraC-like DNA-binding protein